MGKRLALMLVMTLCCSSASLAQIQYPNVPPGGHSSGSAAADIMQRMQTIRAGQPAQNQHRQLREALQESPEQIQQRQYAEYLEKTRLYRNTFTGLLEMQNGQRPFSIKHMVFAVENAYVDNTLNISEYDQLIANKVNLLKALMKSQHIAETNNLGKNYLIQKLFSQQVTETRDTLIIRNHQPYRYDFDDFMGEQDWRNMFVTKLLRTGKGQCHSLPLLYLILAEEIQAKAWLSLAPEHSFITFCNNDNSIQYSFETTNGHNISPSWIMESGYINVAALKNRIYLDTLSKRDMVALCMADLVDGYIHKFGYDVFVEGMIDSMITISPNSIRGYMFKADLLYVKLNYSARLKGLTSVEQVKQDPETQDIYNQMQEQYRIIDALGYMPMPKAQYEAWLRSLNNEKRKQENKKLKRQLINEIKKSN